jgi:hypothetical protein
MEQAETFDSKGARREMKTLITLAVIIVMAVCGTAAVAADFTCTPQQVGANWMYTVTNNHASLDVVEWCVRWSANDTTNAALSLANFTHADASYISVPSQWFRTDADDEPRCWTDDLAYGGAPIMHGGGQKSFTLAFKPGATLPSLFKVAYVQGSTFMWSDCMSIPEPGSIAILLSGLVGSGLFLRRKSA